MLCRNLQFGGSQMSFTYLTIDSLLLANGWYSYAFDWTAPELTFEREKLEEIRERPSTALRHEPVLELNLESFKHETASK